MHTSSHDNGHGNGHNGHDTRDPRGEAAKAVAAFFRFEGVLCTRPTLAAAAWFAVNAQTISSRLPRLSAVVAAAPFALFGETRDDGAVRRLAWAALRDMSEDRLVVLGEEYAAELLSKHVRDEGKELLARARRDGARIVVLSDGLDVYVEPVARALGADEVVSNSMELRASGGSELAQRRATGRLRDPLISGHVSGQWLRNWAADRGVDLAASSAYGAHAGDGLLLSAVGRPCAVSPDRTLRRMAKDLDWPVVESHDGSARI